jgi:hypothetical protein
MLASNIAIYIYIYIYIYINELSVCLNLTIVANEETVCSIVFSYSGCGLRREKHIYIIFLKKDARMS